MQAYCFPAQLSFVTYGAPDGVFSNVSEKQRAVKEAQDCRGPRQNVLEGHSFRRHIVDS